MFVGVAESRRKLMKNLVMSSAVRRPLSVSGTLFYLVEDSNGCEYFISISGIQCFSEDDQMCVAWPKDIINQKDVPVSSDIIGANKLCTIFKSGKVVQFSRDKEQLFKLRSRQLPIGEGETIQGAEWAPNRRILAVASTAAVYFFTERFSLAAFKKYPVIITEEEESSRETSDEESTQSLDSKVETCLTQEKSEEEVGKQLKTGGTGKAILSWTRDSKLVAVSYICPSTQLRRITLFDSDGYRARSLGAVEGDEGLLAFHISGQSIAVCRFVNGARSIDFLDKEGQLLTGLSVPLVDVSEVTWMGYNADSTLFALKHRNSLMKTGEKVLFYHGNNGKYEPRYALRIPEHSIAFWDSRFPYRFIYAADKKEVVNIEFDLVYSTYRNVIMTKNGNSAFVGDLKGASFPPPKCMFAVPFPGIVNEAALNDMGAAYLYEGDIVEFCYHFGLEPTFRKGCRFRLPVDDGTICYDLQYDGTDKLTFIACPPPKGAQCYEILRLSFKNMELESDILYSSSRPIACHINLSGGMAVQFSDGSWILVTEGTRKTADFRINGRLLDTKKPLVRCSFSSAKGALVGLTRDNEVLVNGRVVFRNVQSYSASENVVVVILPNDSSSSMVRAMWLGKLVPVKEPIFVDNPIACGAEVVGFNAFSSTVWLQKSEGSIEEFTVRNLLFDEVKEMIDEKAYAKAIVCMNENGIDLNLIYDHDPEKFLQNVGLFVDDVDSVDHLNLFIMNLTSDDVTKTMYSKYYGVRPKANAECVTKVHGICTALRAYLRTLATHRLAPLYTSFLSTYIISESMTGDYSEAFLHLRRFSKRLNSGEEHVSNWIGYMIAFVSEEKLFLSALRAYDLNLARTVVVHSTQDSKEHLDLLSDLKKFEPAAYQRYQIDLRLSDYKKALENVANTTGKLNEAVKLIKEQKLWAFAARAFFGKQDHKKFFEAYAEDLRDRKLHAEAALLFDMLGKKGQFANCVEKVGSLESVFGPHDKELVEAFFAELSIKQETRTEISESLGAQEDFQLSEDESPVGKLLVICSRKEWASALWIVRAAKDDSNAADYDQLHHTLKKAALTRWRLIVDNCETAEESFKRSAARLDEIRQKKKDELRRCVSGDTHSTFDTNTFTSTTDSDSTDTTSDNNLSIAVNNGSCDSPKKYDYWDSFEDLDLLKAMRKIVDEANFVQKEMKTLLKLLVWVDLFPTAYDLQQRVSKLRSFLKNAVVAAYPPEMRPEMLPGPINQILEKNEFTGEIIVKMASPTPFNYDPLLIRPVVKDADWKLAMLED